MLKRITLVLLSLLMLNSCAELFELMGGEIIVEGYDINDKYIDVYNVDISSFDLSWSEATYNDGSYGSFYYEVYVVEGNEYNSNNFGYNDMVTSGWNITTCNVSGLNPNTTYSFIVGVSENGSFSEYYYNIGSVTTLTAEFIGMWEVPLYEGTQVITLTANTVSVSDYDMYGTLLDTRSGSLTLLPNSYVRLTFDTYTDEYGNTYSMEPDSYEFYWYMSNGNLVLSGNDGSEDVVLYPFDGIDMILYPSYSWIEGELSSYQVKQYHFSVTPGSTYSIAWDDSYQGSGNYDLDIQVSVWDESGTTYLTDYDSGYDNPPTITIPFNVYSITVEVEAYAESSYTGTFAIQVTEQY